MPSCPCDNKNSPVGSTTKTATYLAVLNAWWPRSAPLPLAMPWLGMRVTRAAAERAITTYGALLPALPVSGAAAGTDPRNIEVLTDFAFRMISTEHVRRRVLLRPGHG